MKRDWKLIEIEYDEDDNIIEARIDGKPTKEFDKNNKTKK